MKRNDTSPKKAFALAAHGDKLDKCFNVAYLISGADKEAILSDSKEQHLVYMRMCIAHTLQHLMSSSLLGDIMNRTHANVIYWRRKFPDLYQFDATFKSIYDRFEQLYSQQ